MKYFSVSVQMRENTDHKNSEYGHFSRSDANRKIDAGNGKKRKNIDAVLNGIKKAV